MADTPLVSVVVPCYNHGEYLAEALRSIGTPQARTEIVVVDDGSRDSTANVIASFETANLFRSVYQRNAGLAAARNRGLRESHGEYLVFLDADDRLAPGAIDIGISEIEGHPERAFVSGRCVMMDRAGTLLDTSPPPRIVRDHYRELLRNNYIWTPAAVTFRRHALVRAGGFNPAVNAAADYELYLNIARRYPVYDHARVVAHYRKHPENMSNDAGRMLRETLTVLKRQRGFLHGDTASLEAVEQGCRMFKEFYGTHLSQEIRVAVRSGRWAEAARKAAVLGRYHPGGFWHHAGRKAARTLARRPPETLEP